MDDLQNLAVEGQEEWSYDFLIQSTHVNPEAGGIGGAIPIEWRGERKSWSDFCSSWHEGKLERQLSHVDFLIVEHDPDAILNMENDPAFQRKVGTFDQRSDAWFEDQQRAHIHLARLAFNLPVLLSTGPACTIRILRSIERDPAVVIRPNRLKQQFKNPRRRVLDALEGINVARPVKVEGAETLGDAYEPEVDWLGLVKALNLGKLAVMDLGKGVQRVGLARAKKIADGLLKEPEGEP